MLTLLVSRLWRQPPFYLETVQFLSLYGARLIVTLGPESAVFSVADIECASTMCGSPTMATNVFFCGIDLTETCMRAVCKSKAFPE